VPVNLIPKDWAMTNKVLEDKLAERLGMSITTAMVSIDVAELPIFVFVVAHPFDKTPRTIHGPTDSFS
jgi:hypothetical protein